MLKVPIVKQHRGEIEVEESADEAARLEEEGEKEGSSPTTYRRS